ncbi:hypothetical protein RS022_05080 [Candidatus Phytoplasma rubi]|uniref:Uncharacterized protein n=1 Tax=Candidatus Phytoplasma rubi TaxID=399025 RepID=A0ABY7BRU2_9MOLU|nr:hypothetical protein RS022_05080 [Candidatus Phytoplasma rubi]
MVYYCYLFLGFSWQLKKIIKKVIKKLMIETIPQRIWADWFSIFDLFFYFKIKVFTLSLMFLESLKVTTVLAGIFSFFFVLGFLPM